MVFAAPGASPHIQEQETVQEQSGDGEDGDRLPLTQSTASGAGEQITPFASASR